MQPAFVLFLSSFLCWLSEHYQLRRGGWVRVTLLKWVRTEKSSFCSWANCNDLWGKSKTSATKSRRATWKKSSSWIASSRKEWKCGLKRGLKRKKSAQSQEERRNLCYRGLRSSVPTAGSAPFRSNSLSVSITLLHPFPSRHLVICSFHCQIILLR